MVIVQGHGTPPGKENESESFHLVLVVSVQVRGDIARALLYMDVRYNGQDSSFDLMLSDTPSIGKSTTEGPTYTTVRPTQLLPVSFCPTARLQPPPPSQRGIPGSVCLALSAHCPAMSCAEKAQMGLLSALLDWHKADPPSASEKLRNDRVCSLYQHNRNPFVDHPEFVAQIWGPNALGLPNLVGAPAAPSGVPPAATSSTPSSPGAPEAPGLPKAQEPSSAPGKPGATAPRVSVSGPLPAWVNEIHYDNVGADEGEVRANT